MSANQANRSLQRRAGRTRHPAQQRRRPGPRAVASGPRTSISPDTVLMINRRTADLTLAINSGGSFALFPPVGFSGTPFLALGAAFSDNPVPGPATQSIGFAMQLVIESLAQSNDILGLFAEYQIRGVQIEFESLMGDSYNPTFPLPEVITAIDPTAASAPTSTLTIEAYGNTKRMVLTNQRRHNVRLRPRIASQVFGSSLVTSYVYEANQDALWIPSNNGTSPPYYGLVGIVRNFPTAIGNGCQIRISGSVQVAMRRPH